VDVHTALVERAIHLVLFITGGVSVGVVALAAAERLTDSSGKRTIRAWHAFGPVALFATTFLVERLYHALS
jgi:hypothetical protein